jgi:hypothetical protein
VLYVFFRSEELSEEESDEESLSFPSAVIFSLSLRIILREGGWLGRQRGRYGYEI